MRRSFGGNRGMGGGDGGMVRTVQRVVKAGGVRGAAQDPFSHPTVGSSNFRPTAASNILSLTSPTSSSSSLTPFNVPISAASTLPNWPASPTCGDDFDWEFIGAAEDERARGRGYFDDSVIASVPTTDEVHLAISSLQHVLDPASLSQYVKDMLPHCSDSDSSVDDQLTEPTSLIQRTSSGRSGSDWIEPPSLQFFNQGAIINHGFNGVYDAFHLLQTEPLVQRLVISLSSDRAVWEAVLNNEVVQELKESFNQVGSESLVEVPSSSSDDGDQAVNILNLFLNNAKEKVSELFEGIWKMFAELFRQPDKKTTLTDEVDDLFQERLRSSFFLSVLVMLIVVVTRAQS